MPFNGHIKKAVCNCGSKDLKAVAGRWTDRNGGGWDYYDRSGGFCGFIGIVPQFPSIEEEVKDFAEKLNAYQLELFDELMKTND
jgi:hypothetical protein